MLRFLHLIVKYVDALLTRINSLSVLAALEFANSFVEQDNRSIAVSLLHKDIVLVARLVIETELKEGNAQVETAKEMIGFYVETFQVCRHRIRIVLC